MRALTPTAVVLATALALCLPETTTAQTRVRFPAGVEPTAPLAVSTVGGDRIAKTSHTVGDMLCPLVADGWTLSVRLAPPFPSNPHGRNVIYSLKRDAGEKMTFYTVRLTNAAGLKPIEILDTLFIGTDEYAKDAAMPVLMEIFAHHVPGC